MNYPKSYVGTIHELCLRLFHQMSKYSLPSKERELMNVTALGFPID